MYPTQLCLPTNVQRKELREAFREVFPTAGWAPDWAVAGLGPHWGHAGAPICPNTMAEVHWIVHGIRKPGDIPQFGKANRHSEWERWQSWAEAHSGIRTNSRQARRAIKTIEKAGQMELAKCKGLAGAGYTACWLRDHGTQIQDWTRRRSHRRWWNTQGQEWEVLE